MKKEPLKLKKNQYKISQMITLELHLNKINMKKIKKFSKKTY